MITLTTNIANFITARFALYVSCILIEWLPQINYCITAFSWRAKYQHNISCHYFISAKLKIFFIKFFFNNFLNFAYGWLSITVLIWTFKNIILVKIFNLTMKSFLIAKFAIRMVASYNWLKFFFISVLVKFFKTNLTKNHFDYLD